MQHSSNITITVDPLPAQFNVTGGGAFCTGGTGVAVGLSESQNGVNYQLQIGGVNTGSPVAGTGAAISFGLQTVAGAYTVVATSTSATACQNNMTGSVTVTADPLPTQFNVTGGGAFCTGGTGVAVGLSGSQNGVNYQLQIGGVNTGSPVAGTGAAISFGLQTVAGHTVVATSTSATACQNNMTGSVTVTADPLPTQFNVTGGGAFCTGGTGVAVGLSGSQNGVNYQLQIGGVNTGSPVAGTGAAISFGLQTVAGAYTVVATSTSATACQNNMTGSVTVTADPLPTQFNVTGGGAFCTGGTGVAVGLPGSQNGVNYQLQIGGVNTGSPVAGTGAAISFGLQTVAGAYTVVATSTSATACQNNMTGSVTVTADPLPTQFNVTGGKANFCTGGTGVAVGLSGSQNGVNYQLQIGGVNTGSPVAGTGATISFGLQTVAGAYTVVATSTSATACQNNMTGSVTVTADPLPTQFNVTGGGAFGTGGTGVAVGLSGSQNGVNLPATDWWCKHRFSRCRYRCSYIIRPADCCRCLYRRCYKHICNCLPEQYDRKCHCYSRSPANTI